jgi:hypothetical protein
LEDDVGWFEEVIGSVTLMSGRQRNLILGGIAAALLGGCLVVCVAGAAFLLLSRQSSESDGFTSSPPESPPLTGRNVIVNEVQVDEDTLTALERQFGLRIEDGEYWYDPYSGAWGLPGGPTAGFIPAGLNLGGLLQEDASGGGTGVFINGRELHPQEVAGLEQLFGVVQPGRYWLDAFGNYGFEGGVALGNLVYSIQAAQGGGGGYFASTYGGYVGSDGNTSYFFDSESGCSVMTGDGVSC